jgi:hypothetical protein
VSLLGRTKTFKVWLVESTSIHRAHYKAAALPAIGETIFVHRAEPDDEGRWQTMKTKPVPARVTRVRGGMITAIAMEGEQDALPPPPTGTVKKPPRELAESDSPMEDRRRHR